MIRPPAPRGATLLELLAGLAILLVAVAAAASIVVAGGMLTRRAALASETNDASRQAMARIERDLRMAGFGAPGGLWVHGGSGARRINAVFGAGGGPDGTDELWLVIPEAGVLGDPTRDPGGSVAVTRPGTGALELGTVGTAIATGDLVMVSNMTTAALLTATVVDATSTPATLGYREAEELPEFSNAPHLGGFQVGDRAFRVEVVRYFVDVREATGRPALFRATGTVTRQPIGPPFAEVAGSRQLVADDVEDLQVAFGTGEVTQLAFSESLAPEYVPDLRSVRVSVVARTRQPVRDGQGAALPYQPLAVEDHAPAAGVDGYRRSLYTRRVELLNLDPVNL